MRLCEIGPDAGKPFQLTQEWIVREYMRTHGLDGALWPQVLAEHPEIDVKRFTKEQLNVSLDDFSRSLGWMT